jgi:hypothetical protein
MTGAIPYLADWEPSAGMLKEEVRQLVEEGCDPKWIDALVRTFGASPDPAALWTELQAAPRREDFPFHEPSDLPGIRAARAAGPRRQARTCSDEVLRDRLLGAWLGRCCGCALGKPVELFMGPARGLSSRERIKAYLQQTGPGEYPLRDYFSRAAAKPGGDSLICSASCRENLAFMESDDDIRYTVIGPRVLLGKGADFTTGDVAEPGSTC